MKQVKQALSTPMTRKEFLRLMGTGTLALLGVTNFISLLSKQTDVTDGARTAMRKQTKGRDGFGSRKFGA